MKEFQYAHRDIIGQGDHYLRHIRAMTQEGLHDKGDIAAELAHRDERIALLERLLGEALDTCHLGDDAGLHKRMRAALGLK